MTTPPNTDALRYAQIPDYENYIAFENGQIYSIRSSRFLKPTVNHYGYESIGLYADKKARSFRVHRLILRALCRLPEQGEVGCHYDGNKLNNSLSNLRWDTYLGNAADQVRTGRQVSLERHPEAKLNMQKVKAIRELMANGVSGYKAAAQFGVSQPTTSRIYNNKIWRS